MSRDRVLVFGSYRLDVAGRSLTRDGEFVALPPKAVETLILLAENQGKTVLKEELLETVWSGIFVEEGSLTQAISILRKALGESGDGQQWIRTVPKRGYCFVAPVRVGGDLPEPPAATVAALPQTPLHPRRWWIAAIALAALILAGFLLIYHRKPSANSRLVRLLVLPVENLSGNHEHDYVSDGLTEELIARLSTLDAGRLAVIARTSSMNYKGTHKSLDQIARELHVDYVLESSLRWSGDRLRISAQLVRIQDQSSVWASSYDRKAEDMLAMEGDVAQAISSQIDSNLAGKAASRPPRPAAYLPYLEGRFYWNKRTRESIDQAIILLRRAVSLDPDFARAHSALADCYMSLGLLGAGRPSEMFSQAEKEARVALSIDPNLAEAHTSLAYLKFWEEWDWPAAEREFRKAIALNPDYATAHQWYAEYLRLMGRFDESIVESNRALELDPLSLVINMEAGLPYYFRRQYSEALTHFQKATALDPNFALAYVETGWVYEEMGDLPRAIATLKKAALLDDTAPVLTALAHAYAVAGDTAEAKRILQVLEQRSQRSYVPPFLLASIYLPLGDKERALALLEKDYTEHGWGLVWINVAPKFDALRSEPRFQNLLSKMKFPARNGRAVMAAAGRSAR
jgi:TolB-like protein/DNA-binding winged helix-turn-helix (wHTH) protein/Tfp pilus assembly protein PilF